MRLAITGANSELTRLLACLFDELGDTVIIAPPSRELDLLGPVEPWRDWLADASPDAVIHLAGRKPPSPDQEMTRVNVDGTATLLQAIRVGAPGARVLVASSASVYGQAASGRLITPETPRLPINSYGESRAAQEALVRHWAADSGQRAICMRIFNIVGATTDRITVVPSLIARMRHTEEREFAVLNGSCVRDFIDLRDVASAVVTIAKASAWSHVSLNICSECPTSILELAERLAARMGRSFAFQSVDDGSPSSIAWSVGDNSALRELGWKPVIALDASLDRSIAGAMPE